MKLLMIMCADRIAEEVRSTLDDLIGDGCYAEIPQIFTCADGQKRRSSRAFPGGGHMFFVPDEEETIRQVREQLIKYKDQCDMKPCLKMLVLAVEDQEV